MSVSRDIVERVYREESGRILATLIRVTRDFDVAEDALQDAFVKALARWPTDGLPDNPAAWISCAARNALIDRLRRMKVRRHVPLPDDPYPGFLEEEEAADGVTRAGLDHSRHGRDEIAMIERQLDSGVEDDRLRLIFTCCHPALSVEAQLALTLRTLGGLTTEEIARAFLVPEATTAQRIVRAKRKIREANIPYRIPPDHLLPERLPVVLKVVYLIFNEGYTGTSSAQLIRTDMCGEAVRLARLLACLMPDEPEALGLLALLLLHDSRRPARISPAGEPILLEDQDRTLWDQELIREGREVLERALRRGRAGSYQLQAAIAAVHADAASAAHTDWPQILTLYEMLAQIDPSPVVALNRAVAVAFACDYQRGLEQIEELGHFGMLGQYLYFHAARADLLRRLGRAGEARQAYQCALELAANASERRFLERRLRETEFK
jgi:RNA polymerase sigma-70 factor (ECF subfamily)